MTRGHGWRFLDIGRRLERATNMTTLIMGAVQVEATGINVLEPTLEIADSAITYRRRYFAQPQWPTTLDLLLADETNPRSLSFQVNALADHATNLPRESGDRAKGQQHVEFLRGLLNGADFPTLAESQFTGRNSQLTALLTQFAAELRGLSDSLTRQYFNHATAQVS